MNIEKKKALEETLKSAGYENAATNVFTKIISGQTYGVDTSKDMAFRFDKMERIGVEDDPEDSVIKSIQQIIDGNEGQEQATQESNEEEKNSPAPENDDTSAKSSSSTEDVGTEENEPVTDKSTGTPILDLVYKFVGNDVLEVFGDTGSGKSKFSLTIAKEAIAAGKKVIYLDTERNLTDDDIKDLNGCQYKYTPILEEIDKFIQKLPAADVVIIDSIGFPVLTTYARLSLKQKGDALLKLIAIFGDLKAWAYKNNGVAIVTNQPESEFNKSPGHVLRPFGDKSQFAAKEIWWTEINNRTPDATNINITAFRSRSVGHKTQIAKMKISNNGVQVA